MAIHEACRSQSEAEGDLAHVTQLLVDAGSDVNSKASDAAEVNCSRQLCLWFIRPDEGLSSISLFCLSHYRHISPKKI